MADVIALLSTGPSAAKAINVRSSANFGMSEGGNCSIAIFSGDVTPETVRASRRNTGSAGSTPSIPILMPWRSFNSLILVLPRVGAQTTRTFFLHTATASASSDNKSLLTIARSAFRSDRREAPAALLSVVTTERRIGPRLREKARAIASAAATSPLPGGPTAKCKWTGRKLRYSAPAATLKINNEKMATAKETLRCRRRRRLNRLTDFLGEFSRALIRIDYPYQKIRRRHVPTRMTRQAASQTVVHRTTVQTGKSSRGMELGPAECGRLTNRSPFRI